MKSMLERGRRFVSKIKPSDRVLLIYHADVDGFCSGAFLLTALRESSVKNIESKTVDVEGLKTLIGQIEPGAYDKIIVADLDVPTLKREFDRIGADTLIVDHHMVRGEFDSGKTVYVNPRLVNPGIYQPASYVVYKMLSHIKPIKTREWLAAIGSVADFAFADCKDVVGKYIDIKDPDDLPKTDMWKSAGVLFGAIIYSSVNNSVITTDGVMKMFMDAGGLDNLLEMGALKSASEAFNLAYDEAKSDFLKNAETRGNVIIGVIDNPYRRIGSAIVTNVSVNQKDKIIFLLEHRGERYKISARWQNAKMHLGEFMSKHFNGGGHKKAAGGSIFVEDLDAFKKKVFGLLSK